MEKKCDACGYCDLWKKHMDTNPTPEYTLRKKCAGWEKDAHHAMNVIADDLVEIIPRALMANRKRSGCGCPPHNLIDYTTDQFVSVIVDVVFRVMLYGSKQGLFQFTPDADSKTPDLVSSEFVDEENVRMHGEKESVSLNQNRVCSSPQVVSNDESLLNSLLDKLTHVLTQAIREIKAQDNSPQRNQDIPPTAHW